MEASDLAKVLGNIGWSVIFSLVGAVVGVALVMASAAMVPWFINRVTPNLDEEKELARGNVAVAEYFGRIVAATILGISIIIAAAMVAGIISAWH